jgi:hypothetical protein
VRGRSSRDRGGRARALAALAAVCVLLFAACGSDDGDDGDAGGGGGVYGSGQGAGSEDSTAAEPVEDPSEAGAEGAGESGAEDGGGSGGEAVELPPREAVSVSLTAVLAGGDPEAACGSFVTDTYLDAAYGGRGGCVGAQAPAAVAKSLDVRSIAVDGDRARAIVVPNGGVLDGQKLTVGLVLEGGVWKVESLRADVPVGP